MSVVACANLDRPFIRQCQLGALTLALLGSVTALAHDPEAALDFRLLLQTTGDWSGRRDTGALGFSENTRIVYQWPGGDLPVEGPEYVDMDKHLAALTSWIEANVEADFDGVGILDYERYPATLYDPWHHGIIESRIEAEKAMDPGISHEEALRRAEKKYQPHIQRVLLGSLNRARQLRPDAAWGYYSFVLYDNHLPVDDHFRWINDQVSWLWEEVDVIALSLYPWWYQDEPLWPVGRDLLPDKIAEARRLASSAESASGTRPIVLPYQTSEVVSVGSPHYRKFITPQQTLDYLSAAVKAGADGVILWQHLSDEDPRYKTEEQYWQILDGQVKSAVESLGLLKDGKPVHGQSRVLRPRGTWTAGLRTIAGRAAAEKRLLRRRSLTGAGRIVGSAK